MPEITVRRPEEGWANQLRSYKILVDGEAAATLPRGDETTVSVAPGQHTVRAIIDWGGSPTVELELRDDEHAYLLCQSGFSAHPSRPKTWLYSTIWRKRYLDLQLIRVERSG